MSAPREASLMNADNFIWSQKAEVALLEQVREVKHLWDPQDELYKKHILRKYAFQRVADSLKMFPSLQGI
ncbi:hypothetical protein E2C01_084718 [Portunus trituberculatus]|uniref:MADF domain-containing protein n=1 Tax=Portunus trituberculatus TaxID=210409 RepID=A0A5B7J4Y0_PORTR|nr:hypothetical protein [Portunus trituberculatus]